jgi:plastocyanin
MTQEDEQFEDFARKERAWHEWLMVGVGLTALLSVMAIIVSVVALASKSSTTTVQAAAPTSGMSARMASSGGSMPMSASTGKPVAVKLVVKSDSEHAVKGPDGKYHDAFIPADFTIHAGDRVRVTVYNYDDMPHSWTATDMGVNQTIAAGSETAPSKTTFTFTAPSAGKYEWWCALPCDPYAMSTDGLMRGYVTVAA